MPTKVKICGLRTPDTMAVALEAGADYVGLVLFPPSPRNVSLEQARELAAPARGRARIVALVVDADDASIARIVAELMPDLLQLHGNEGPQRVAAVRARSGLPVIKAIKVATAADAAMALRFTDVADLILFDARPPEGADRPGGHGATFDWRALDGVRHKVPFMLSGGLNPLNVADAIRATGAPAVDVSSGVESRPGVKEPALIRAFIAAAKAAVPA
ncbi:MAG: phosphoribosylanthranilate isomerase [Hyphomicrobiaceae bacterium]|nr:phosphoribosylanthranilate isomerase [Hyphomicrobiaceae bacterium]